MIKDKLKKLKDDKIFKLPPVSDGPDVYKRQVNILLCQKIIYM